MAIEYALKYQQHLKGLIISNMAASMKSYEVYINKLRRCFPVNVQKAMQNYEEKGEFENPSYYKLLFQYLYSKHFCRLSEYPEPVTRCFSHKNKVIYDLMQGPNDFSVTGNLKEWNRWADISNIHVPTLIIGATYDVINPDDIRKMGQIIPKSKVFISKEGSHLAFYDDQLKYFHEVISFLDFTSKFKRPQTPTRP